MFRIPLLTTQTFVFFDETGRRARRSDARRPRHELSQALRASAYITCGFCVTTRRWSNQFCFSPEEWERRCLGVSFDFASCGLSVLCPRC